MDSNSARQFANVQVDSDQGARGMMNANAYTEPPISMGANTQGAYNQGMAVAFMNRKGLGQKVMPISKLTMQSTTWTPQG